MNTSLSDVKQYDTEAIFLSKTAAGLSLLERLGMGVLNYELTKGNQEKDRAQIDDATLHELAARELEELRSESTRKNLKHTQAPALLAAGSDVPVGWDEGMVRLASIAAVTGSELAKEAGIGDFVTMAKTMGSKALSAGAGALSAGSKAVAAGVGAAKGLIPAAPTGAGKVLGHFGLKTNLALGAAAIGAGVLGSKALHATGRAMSAEPDASPTYGTPTRGVGTQLAYGVNQYGQPQVGTQL